MVWQLIKRDPIALMIPAFGVFVPGAWWFSNSVDYDVFLATGLISGWGLMIAVVVLRRGRYSLLDVTLPIAGKQLFLSRVALLLTLAWLPTLGAVAVSMVREGVEGFSRTLPLFMGSALVTVALLSIQCVRVETISAPGWLIIPIPLIAFLPAVMVGFQEPVALAITVLGGCAVVSAALFLKAWAGVPKSFQLAPATLLGRAAAPMRAARTGNTRFKSPWWLMFQVFVSRPIIIGNWIFVAFNVMLFSGVSWFPVGAPGLSLILPFALSLFPGYYPEWRWLLPLPIPPRKLLWMAWLPCASAILLGALATVFFDAPSHRPPVTLGHTRSLDGPSDTGESGTLNVRVGGAYWLRARGGIAPVIQAPWGETYRPEISTELRLPFYNPYSVGRQSSQQFLEWQFQRATQEIYGQPLTVSQADALPRMKTIEQRPKARMVIVTLALLFFLLQMCAVHLSGGKRLRYTRRGLRFFLVVAPIPAMVSFAIFFPGPRDNFSLDALVLNLARVLPDNLWTLAPMAAALIAGLYWLAEKLWREMEFSQIEAMVPRQQGALR